MELEEELLARVRAAHSFDNAISLSHFQVRAGQSGSVLINLKTGKSYLIFDDDSPLEDFRELLPCKNEQFQDHRERK